VLDLYAGSGALGIEALSRGAEHVDFVETSPQTRRLIEANLRVTGLEPRASVRAFPVARAVSTLGHGYDLILADPPYEDAEARRVLEEVGGSVLTTARTILIWEHRSDFQPPLRLGRLLLRRTLRHGLTVISLYAGELAWPAEAEGAQTERVRRTRSGSRRR